MSIISSTFDIERSFYLSDENNIDDACSCTGLDIDEIEAIVGRFKPWSRRAGQLRGEVVIFFNGNVCIRHHFTKKLLWSL